MEGDADLGSQSADVPQHIDAGAAQLRAIAEHIEDVRVRVFGEATSRQQMATLLGLPGYRAYGSLVNPEARANNATYTKVLRAWEARGVGVEDRRRLVALLTSHASGLQRFYEALAFEVGHKEFQARTRVKHLASRQQRGVFPDYLEPLAVVDELFPGDEHAERRTALKQAADGVWTAESSERYRRRGIEPFFAEFLTALEKRCRCDGHPYAAATLQKEYGLTQEQAAMLVSAELPPWSRDMHTFTRKVLGQGRCEDFQNGQHIRALWRVAAKRETPRQVFSRRMRGLSEAQGISGGDLARWLSAGDPDSALPGAVRASMERAANSYRAPAAVLIALVARDDRERSELTSLFRAAREEHERRSGSAIYADGGNAFGLELSIECDLVGLTLDDVARELVKDAVGKSDRAAARSAADRLKKIQMGVVRPGDDAADTACVAPLEREGIMAAIERLRRAKVTAAQKRRSEVQRPVLELPPMHSVSHAVEVLVDAAGSATALADALREHGEESLMLSHARLVDIVDGQYLPPWPYVQNILAAAERGRGWQLADRLPALRNAWLRAYPQYLVEHRGAAPAGNPLARILRTLIEERASSLEAFATAAGLSYKVLHRQLSELEKGGSMTPAAVEGVLRAAGCTSRSPIWEVALTAARDPSQTWFALADTRIGATQPPLIAEYPGLLPEEFTLAKIPQPQ